MTRVVIDGVEHRPVDEEEASELADRLRSFRLEGTTHWREHFIEWDTVKSGAGAGGRYGMYSEGDEEAPFFSEAFLYNLLGKDEARSVLGIVRRLCALAGVEFR